MSGVIQRTLARHVNVSTDTLLFLHANKLGLFLTEVSEGIKAVTAGGVGLHCEAERAGNAGVHFKRATSVTLTGLVADGGSLRFIIKGYPLASRPFFPRLTPSRAESIPVCGPTPAHARVELLWNQIPSFPDSRSPVQSACAITPPI